MTLRSALFLAVPLSLVAACGDNFAAGLADPGPDAAGEPADAALVMMALHVDLAGDGAGSVAAPGIACGDDCDEEYAAGTEVVLTATPAAGSELVGWSLASCPGTGPCTVSISEAMSVTAEFGIQRHALTVMVSGAGQVASSPAGIACGGEETCSGSFAHGATVELTATADAGNVFAGWGGACIGTGRCSVSVDDAALVTASFAAQPMVTVYQTTGSWSCASLTSCEDVYDVQLAAGASLGINVSSITGSSAVRLAAYQGSEVGVTNLLTGNASDLMCADADVATGASFVAPAAGRYRIAVARDWDTSGGSSGTYVLTLGSLTPFVADGATADDIAGAASRMCNR
jgi:hypothetical protein